jgi:hypothetical protein
MASHIWKHTYSVVGMMNASAGPPRSSPPVLIIWKNQTMSQIPSGTKLSIKAVVHRLCVMRLPHSII